METEDKSPLYEIEKSFENFNSSISSIEKAYGKIRRQIDEYRVNEIVPRDYLKEMAGNLAHEIRNPLGGIANLVELLSDDQGIKQTKNIQGILEGIGRIDKIVENLIVFSRPVVLQPVNCDFCDILNRAIETVKTQFIENEDRYVFSLKKPDERVYVKIDPLLMLQAIQNLLRNAVEVMPDGGNIKLFLSENKRTKKLILHVEDEGPGVIDGNEEKPFYPFFTTRTHGMGLGLPTTRLIVEKHGGRIWLKNKPGKGVVVTLNLPIT